METKIQELRKANKISQAELADEMGVHEAEHHFTRKRAL